MQVASCILFFLYSSYFVIIAYVAFFQIKDMKKSYKFSLFLTFGVICACIIILFANGM
jgi:FtsH-binding integral membrane protein